MNPSPALHASRIACEDSCFQSHKRRGILRVAKRIRERRPRGDTSQRRKRQAQGENSLDPALARDRQTATTIPSSPKRSQRSPAGTVHRNFKPRAREMDLPQTAEPFDPGGAFIGFQWPMGLETTRSITSRFRDSTGYLLCGHATRE